MDAVDDNDDLQLLFINYTAFEQLVANTNDEYDREEITFYDDPNRNEVRFIDKKFWIK